jgi:4-amino-4-deoxy-L-arabinose transferase
MVDLLVLSLVAMFGAWSFFSFRRGNYGIALLLLFLSSFVLRFWVAALDPFLHDWDERFHAIVAKNMMNHPFKPMLHVDPVISSYDFTAWCCNHVWLHKQPLFLWQMALSLKIFGVSEWALRLPSVLMCSLLVFPVFRMGLRLFDETAAYIAAFTWAFGYYSIELSAGTIGMDHNDVAFCFYVTLSVWAFVEYMHRQTLRYALLAGLFAGFAVLCKWLAGTLVFAGFGVFLFQQRFAAKTLRDFGAALIATLAVALPWQVYTFWMFPQEARYEMAYNAKHIFETLENHGGSALFYWGKMPFQYAAGFGFVLLLSLLFFATKIAEKPLRGYLLMFVALPYFFFSVVAQTKLPSYVFLVSPLVFLLAAPLFAQIYAELGKGATWRQLVLQGAMMLTLAIYFLRFPEIKSLHLKDEPTPYLRIEGRENKLHNTNIYRKLNDLVPAGHVVLNTKSFEDTEAMFYSDRQVFHWWFNEKDYATAKAAGYKFAAFADFNEQVLPDYIRQDESLFLIREVLK